MRQSLPTAKTVGMRRPLRLVLMSLIALAGCGAPDERAPFTDSRIPTGIQTRFYPPDGWGWGLIKVGDHPAARYGVSAPPSQPRADVLILAAYGEPAETWFETANDLNARGYVVWVLEQVGQGGSGRYSGPRDLGDAPSLDADADAARALADRVVRRRPLIVIASRTSAPEAVQALRRGLLADGVVLSAPGLTPDPPATLSQARTMRRWGLGWRRADGGTGWSRDGPDDRSLGLTHDALRGRVRLAWQMANPDLRMGGPSWRWRAGFADAVLAASSGSLAKLKAPTIVLQPSRGLAAAQTLCRRLPHCTVQPFGPAGDVLQLETDEPRKAWLQAVIAFVETDIARFSPPPVGARVTPEG